MKLFKKFITTLVILFQSILITVFIFLTVYLTKQGKPSSKTPTFKWASDDQKVDALGWLQDVNLRDIVSLGNKN